MTNAADTSHIYSYDEVQTPAVPSRSNPKPKWPGNMRETIDNSHSQAGERPTQTYAEELNQASVVAKFVVDTLGCMDFSTFTVVSATDSAFADEVRQILPRLRFTAGQQNGHKVRSWLEWKFLFLKKAGAVTPFGSEN